MGLLRGYYGLASMTGEGSEGTEMDVYKIDAKLLHEDQPHVPHVKHSSDIRNTSIFRRCSKRSIFKYF
jgi:hypothetical protein